MNVFYNVFKCFIYQSLKSCNQQIIKTETNFKPLRLIIADIKRQTKDLGANWSAVESEVCGGFNKIFKRTAKEESFENFLTDLGFFMQNCLKILIT